MNTIKRDAAEPESHDDLMRFLGVFWERKSFVFLGIVLGLVVGTIYYVKVKPVYQSSARVLIVKKNPDVIPIHGGDPRMPQFDDYVGTQQVLIRSPAVLSFLVDDPEFDNLSFSKNKSVAIEQIMGSLRVLRGADKEMEGGTTNAVVGGGASVLTFIYRAGNPDECSTIIRLLLKAYNAYLKNTYSEGNDSFTKLIADANKVQEGSLKLAQEKKRKLLADKPELVMKQAETKDGLVGISAHFLKLQDQKAALEERKMVIDSHLKSLAVAELNHASPIVLKSLVAKFDRSATEVPTKAPLSDADLDNTLFKLMLEQLRLSRYGKDHGAVQDLRKQIDFINEKISLRDSGNGVSQRAAEQIVKLHREVLHQDLVDIGIREEQLDKVMKAERANSSEWIKDQMDLADLDQNINSLTSYKQLLYDQAKKLEITRGAGGFQADPLSLPTLAIQVEPRAILTFSLAAVAGLMVGLALAYLTDLTDRSFRTPVEIARSLRMPVIGHVPVITAKALTDQSIKLSPYLCTHHRPKSRDAEAFRAIRTALYFNTRNTSCRKLQVTSASSGDGKSTMASNLAISIAQSGKRVLLVDCDLRRPTVHTLFGLTNDAGFSNVLTGHTEPADVTHVDIVPGLSLISAGPSLPNPAEILTSSRFQDCANHLAEKYDFVLFDTPPLLAVTDPAVIAPRMDGVFLVVRLDKSGRGMAERSAEILRTLEVNVIGVVVNAGKEGVGYYGGYGSYGKYYYGRYSYYYGSGGYRYGNGYTYGNEAYYSDEEKPGSDVIVRPATNGHTAAAAAAKSHENGTNDDEPTQPGSIKRAFRWFMGD